MASRFASTQGVWTYLLNGAEKDVVGLYNKHDKPMWAFRKQQDQLVAICYNKQYSFLVIRNASDTGFELFGDLHGSSDKVLFKFADGGLTRAGRHHFRCREMIPVYIGPSGELEFKYHLRLK